MEASFLDFVREKLEVVEREGKRRVVRSTCVEYTWVDRRSDGEGGCLSARLMI